LNELVSWLEGQGDMPFDAFVAGARAQGLRPELWLRAKQQGRLHTYFDANGVHRIAPGAAQPEGVQ